VLLDVVESSILVRGCIVDRNASAGDTVFYGYAAVYAIELLSVATLVAPAAGVAFGCAIVYCIPALTPLFKLFITSWRCSFS